MICPDCGNRMKCFDTGYDKENMRVARRYKCPVCYNKIHTMETCSNKNEVNYVLSMKWRNNEREVKDGVE